MKTPDLDALLRDPTGWQQGFLGIVYPVDDGPVRIGYDLPVSSSGNPRNQRIEFHLRQQSGFTISRDGVSVFDQERGGWRDADWREAARIRAAAIEGFGPEVARVAGIEPE
jgi:hypothetical protein